MYHSRLRSCAYSFSIIFCLLIVLSACNQPSGNGQSSTPSPTPTHTTIPTAIPTPTSEQTVARTCPAQGTARAAVMPAITVGSHPNIVYLSQQDNGNMLQRYDITTASTTTILQPNETGPIQMANISPDKQWILFVSPLQNQPAIQLVRIDGQQWQILYCAPAQTSIDAALLSPNQHYLVFNQVNQDMTMSILYLLDITTGHLQTELSPQQPNYPGIAQGQQQTTWFSSSMSSSPQKQATSSFRAQEFSSLASRNYLTYIPIKWANNSSVYLHGTIAGAGGVPHQLALLRDISKDATQQQSNLQPIANTTQGNICENFDVTPDNQQLVCGTQPTMGQPIGPATIQMQPITGGASHLVYHGPTGGSIKPRALTNSTLIFLLDVPNSPSTLWKISTNGSGLTQLMAAKTTDTIFNFADYSYLPWSTMSPDGTLYALGVSSFSTAAQSLIFGNLNGSTSKTIASNTQALTLVGWSQM